MKCFQLLESNRNALIRYESIRQIYLDKGMDADWVNNRIDGFIDKENKCLQRCIRLMRCEQQNKSRFSLGFSSFFS
jgi:hypothetical protein